MYKIVFTGKAVDDIGKLKASNLSEKAKALVEILREDPYRIPPPCEKLIGDLEGMYSRRINIKHRLVYQVTEEQKTVKIIRMWSHYE